MSQLPTLPGMVDGIVGHDLLGWTVQCRACGATSTAQTVLAAITLRDTHFHDGGWPDGSNPRLCRDCRPVVEHITFHATDPRQETAA